MWEVKQVYDSVGSMFTSWKVGRMKEDGKMEWAGPRTKSKAKAEAEAKFWNEREEKK